MGTYREISLTICLTRRRNEGGLFSSTFPCGETRSHVVVVVNEGQTDQYR